MNKYYVKPLNSSKANQFVSYYHYSGVGFTKADLNLGVYRIEDNLLVGVLQWGRSFQEAIRLDRYVKTPIGKEEYYELNRFCMADSEGANAESQAISLGIKWIKKNRKDIRLLVSYAGRKEGNYGYIYQATSWTYLGYFVSPGFWIVDGQERHLMTLWYYTNKYGDENLSFKENVLRMYNSVIQTWTKQFIYVKLLDSSLELASEVLPYPKPDTDYPIKIREETYKSEPYKLKKKEKGEPPVFYYDKNEPLFTRRTLIRRGELEPADRHTYLNIGYYDLWGHLIEVYNNLNEIKIPGCKIDGIREAIKNGRGYKDKYFVAYSTKEEILEEIDVPIIGIVDEIPFNNFAEMGRYLGVSRQAVQQARKRTSSSIAGRSVDWVYDT